MADLQIRRGISYQADYLDLKGLNMKNEDVLRDLANIQSLTNVEESSHLSVLLDINHDTKGMRYNKVHNEYVFRNLLFSLLGIPLHLFEEGQKVEGTRKEIDLSCLSEDIRNKLKVVTISGKTPGMIFRSEYEGRKRLPREKVKENMVGVVFLHTLLFKSEISVLLNHLAISFPIIQTTLDKQLHHYKKDTTTIERINSAENNYNSSFYNRNNTKLTTSKEIEPFKNESFNPMSFTMMVVVPEDYNFIQSSIDIYNKKTSFREHSLLNWYISPISYSSNYFNVNVFGDKHTVYSTSINFTYFPSELVKTYYNKYVGGMTTNLVSNFVKLPTLNSCFSFIEGKNTKKIYKELTGFFNFIVLPENLINIMRINSWSGTFYKSVLSRNEISFRYAIPCKYKFIIHFLGDILMNNYLLGFLDNNSKLPVGSFIKAVKELEINVNKINEVCKEYNIDTIVPTTLKDALLYYMYYFFITDTIETKDSQKQSQYFTFYREEKPTTTPITLTSYRQELSLRIQREIITLVKHNSVEEVIEIYLKARELYYFYLKDSFITFLTLNKDFREVIESYKIGKNTPYVNAIGNNIDYITFGNIFLQGGFNTWQISSMARHYQTFVDRQIKLKFDNLVNHKKEPPEYRLYHVLLKVYGCTLFKLHVIHKGTIGNDYSYGSLFEFFGSNQYKTVLNSKITFEEHIKKIITLLETIFDFYR